MEPFSASVSSTCIRARSVEDCASFLLFPFFRVYRLVVPSCSPLSSTRLPEARRDFPFGVGEHARRRPEEWSPPSVFSYFVNLRLFGQDFSYSVLLFPFFSLLFFSNNRFV